MTLFLCADDVRDHISEQHALTAMETAFEAESKELTKLPPRLDVSSPNGFLRVMPAVLGDVMGLKVMTLAEGLGTRYLVMLYDVEHGELLAMIDADELTRLRTGATTAIAARLMVDTPPRQLGVIGSGFEAIGQLRALAALWPLEDVAVYSPTEARRVSFSKEMSKELSINVHPVETSRAALEGQAAVVLATKAKNPVIDGSEFDPGTVVLSIGSTRLDLRELDRTTLARAGVVVGDDPHQLELESGDIADALEAGVLSREHMVSIAELSLDPSLSTHDDTRDLEVFKSVGTALQDLAIAQVAYQDALDRNYGTALGEIAGLKPFAAKA